VSPKLTVPRTKLAGALDQSAKAKHKQSRGGHQCPLLNGQTPLCAERALYYDGEVICVLEMFKITFKSWSSKWMLEKNVITVNRQKFQ
jgi:hypothetical protein